MTEPRDDLAAVVLAAGFGTRLRPLTELRPKARRPVGDVALVDLAIARVAPHAGAVAVNVHAHAALMHAHLVSPTARAANLGRDLHVSDEQPVPLGSGGALGHLHDWVAGRPVLVTNVDAYLDDDLATLVEGWDGERPRLLVRTGEVPADFGPHHYVGACLVPAAEARRCPTRSRACTARCGWPAWTAGRLEVVEARGAAIDCGTPSDYLRANLHASGGASVVGVGAVVRGELERAVVWPGGVVAEGERLVEVIRAGADLTVPAPLS